MKRIWVLLICLLFTLHTRGQSTDDYKKSVLNIEDDNDFSTFSMLDSIVGKYNVFFTGENHLFRKSNYKLQLKMLKYLHQKAGVRHLLLEFGYSRGWLINQYVQTGDSTLFNTIDDYSYKEYALLYKEIWEYNKTLDSNKRIIVTGIDLERFWNTPIKVLSILLPKTKAPEDIEIHIDAIHALAFKNDDVNENKKKEKNDAGLNTWTGVTYNPYSQRKSFEEILKNYDEHRAQYEQFAGKNWSTFSQVMESLRDHMKWEDFENNKQVQEVIYREKYMYDNFIKLAAKYPDDKFYSQFGRCHTTTRQQDFWCDFTYYHSLASRIYNSENPYLKGKVCSIAGHYTDHEYFAKESEREPKLKDIKKAAADTGLTLFYINHDTLLYGKLAENYTLVFINKNKQEDDVVNVKKKDAKNDGDTYIDKYGDYEYALYMGYEFHYGITSLSLTSLQPFYEQYGKSAPSSPLKTLGGSYSFFENGFGYGSLSLNFIQAISTQLNDTSSITFSGADYKIYFGGDLTNSGVLNIIPRGGIGFANLKIKQEDNYTGTTTGGFFNEGVSETKIYRNPAIVFDAGLDIKINIGVFTVGVLGGYQFDVSNKNWRRNGEFINPTVKTSYTGYYALAQLGFFFKD